MQDVPRKQCRGDAPRQGIGPENDADILYKMQRDRQVGNAQCAPDRQHDHHRHNGTAQPAQDTRAAVAERQQAVEQRRRARLPHAEGDDLRLAAERAHQLRAQQVDAHAHDLRQQDRAKYAEFHTLAHTVGLTRTDILADKGRQRHRKAGHRQKGEALHLGIRAAARHGVGTEGVDVGLHNDVGQRNDRVLHTGWQPLLDDRLQGRPVKANFLPVNGPFLLRAHQLGERQHSADRLADNGRKSRRADTHPHTADQNDIQHNVDNRRRNQIPHGAAAVADRLQNAGAHIVHDHRDRAEKVGAEVRHRVDQNVFGRTHPAQDLRGQQHAHHRQHRARRKPQRHRGVDRAAQTFPVLGTEIPRHHNARAQRHAVDKARQQKNQAAGGADRRQRLAAQKIAHDQRVGGIVQLLKQVADEDRQGKQQHPLGHAAFG